MVAIFPTPTVQSQPSGHDLGDEISEFGLGDGSSQKELRVSRCLQQKLATLHSRESVQLGLQTISECIDIRKRPSRRVLLCYIYMYNEAALASRAV